MKKINFILITCLFYVATVCGQTTQKSYKNFSDTVFKVNDLIIAPEIIFDLSSCRVRPESIDSVSIIAKFIKRYPNYKMEIMVHTDQRGNAIGNIKISTCRANSLLSFLKENFNVPLDNIMASGQGENHPIISEDQIKKIKIKTEEDLVKKELLYRKNRRVEIKILSI